MNLKDGIEKTDGPCARPACALEPEEGGGGGGAVMGRVNGGIRVGIGSEQNG